MPDGLTGTAAIGFVIQRNHRAEGRRLCPTI